MADRNILSEQIDPKCSIMSLTKGNKRHLVAAAFLVILTLITIISVGRGGQEG